VPDDGARRATQTGLAGMGGREHPPRRRVFLLRGPAKCPPAGDAAASALIGDRLGRATSRQDEPVTVSR